MIELFYYFSGNVNKVSMYLEEAGLDYTINFVDCGKGEQFSREDVLRVAPNSKVPAIIDHDPIDGGAPISLFESGAILLYLADKTGQFLAKDLRTRNETLQWLFWQMAGLGPIGGQLVHFRNFAPEKNEYALQRYGAETERLIGVLDKRLEGREFMIGDYSIADIACYPWIVAHDRRKQLDFTPFPNVKRWFDAIAARPGTQRAYARMAEVTTGPLPKSNDDLSDETRRIMFGAHAVAGAKS